MAKSIWHRNDPPYLDVFLDIAPSGNFSEQVYRAQCTYNADDDHGFVCGENDVEWTYSENEGSTFEFLAIVPPAIKEYFTSNIPHITAAFVAWRLGDSA